MARFRHHAALLCALLFIIPAARAQKAARVPAVKIARAGAKPGEWTFDFEAAKTAAGETGLPILLLFTVDGNAAGNTLRQQILDQAAWKKFAAQNLLLVWVEEPNSDGKVGAPAQFAETHKTLQPLRPNGSPPSFTVLDSDAKTSLGAWSGIAAHHTPEYFCDLVKSHIVTRTNSPSASGPAPAPRRPPPAGPQAAAAGPAIKPAREGAKPGEWTMDFEAAQKLAGENKTPMVVFITGSDWNRLSQTTVKNIFARPAWDKFAKDNRLSLVWADFPENKSLVPENQAARFGALRRSLVARDAFPACVLLGSDGFIKLAVYDKDLASLTLKGLQDAVKPHLPKK